MAVSRGEPQSIGRRRGLAARLPPRLRLALYPPFWLMRLKIVELDPHWRRVRIRLPLTRLTRNPGGTMFGGSQAALADPIAALACARNFPGHSVWTRSLSIDFIHEARGDLDLRFEFTDLQIEQIRTELAARGRATPQFEYGYHDSSGRLCTVVHARIAIRPRGYRPARPETADD